MDETVRLLLWLALAGAAVTFAGSAAIWFMDEERRIRRAFRHGMKVPADAVIVSVGRGRGAGFSFSRNLAAVAWESGTWCLVYRLEELVGVELIVDGDVRARVYRGETRRALEQTSGGVGQVSLRLIFDDARYPDFELELWGPGDATRRNAPSPVEAIQEGNRWVARAEAILRRAAPARAAAVRPAAPPRHEPAPVAAPVAAPGPAAAADDPPWDEDEPPAPRARATSRRAVREPETRDLFDDPDEAFS